MLQVSILKKNLNEINWVYLCENENPEVIPILLENPDKIEWYSLSKNPNAIKLLEENQDKINWSYLSKNSAIFELDYEKMTENNLDFYEDLIKEVMKPSRVFKERDYDYLEELFG